jgi:hypothetical protein
VPIRAPLGWLVDDGKPAQKQLDRLPSRFVHAWKRVPSTGLSAIRKLQPKRAVYCMERSVADAYLTIKDWEAAP